MLTVEEIADIEKLKQWLSQFPLKKQIPFHGETKTRIMQVLELHRAEDRAYKGVIIRVRRDRETGELLAD